MTTHTLAEMAKALNRPAVVVSSLQDRFELPAFEGAGYSDAYLAFLKTVVCLRTLGIAEDRLLRLWTLEKKLLQLLHVDSTGSRTWFLDSCGITTRRDRRLLLSRAERPAPARAPAQTPPPLAPPIRKSSQPRWLSCHRRFATTNAHRDTNAPRSRSIRPLTRESSLWQHFPVPRQSETNCPSLAQRSALAARKRDLRTVNQ